MHKILVLLLVLCPALITAQRTVQRLTGLKGQQIGFYQYLPPGYNTDKASKHPMIIFLHGIGEKGTGNETDLQKINCCGIAKYINLGNKMEFTWNGKTEGFVVLYPQLASKYGTWENYYIDEMIRYAKQQLNVDTNRIFLTGLSLGGGGSWVYASSSVSNGRRLAGIVPVVSPCFMINGCNIANANLPILAIHALDDDLADPHCTVDAIKSINACHPSTAPNLIMFDNGAHYVWVKRAYDTAYNYINPNIYEWMLAQNRTFKPNKKPAAAAGKDITISAASGRTVLDGTASTDLDGKIVRYVWQKISGPPYGILEHDVTSKPILSGLHYPGVYTFELKVVDDRAEWGIDKVTVTVVDGNVMK